MNNITLYLITVVIWGSTWIAITYQIGSVEPEVSLVYRFGLAALVLFLFCRLTNMTLKLSLRQHLQCVGLGVTLFGCNYFMLYQASGYINSALTSIAFSTLLLFNIVNARIWYKTAISIQVYLGGTIGLLGIVTLFWPEISAVELADKTMMGLGLCLIGTLFASAGNMISIKNQSLNMPIMQTNAWGMAYGALLMTFLTIVQGKTFTFDFSMPYIVSLLYLSIFGSVIAFGCYLTLLGRIGAQKTSYANIMFPAVAVLISTFLEGFVWSQYTIIGLLLIGAGNLVVLVKPRFNRHRGVVPALE